LSLPDTSEGLLYDPGFLKPPDRAELVSWLSTVHPLWENRYSDLRPARAGQQHRRLLRPVFWLGHWQFACLDYYKPPLGVEGRCVRADPFPPVLTRLVDEMERLARRMFSGADLPVGWKLNTCLINLYGLRRKGDKWIDTARVGEHKDFEPGPVASLSLGEPALFQFVETRDAEEDGGVVAEQWLEDGSLQIFGGEKWKSTNFHRVLRVGRRGGHRFDFAVEGFKTRRVNFTFRHVPEEHAVAFADLPAAARRDIEGYLRTLAEHSPFFAAEVARASSP
jgi:DNA oxidative demethylase